MFLICVLMMAIIFACITAGHYEDGKPIYTVACALVTSVLFTYYMVGIQS